MERKIMGVLDIFEVFVGKVAEVVKGLTLIELGIEALKAVGKAIVSLAKSLGLIEEKTEVESLGDSALQAEAEGICPEKYDNYGEYVKAVENFKVDPEKSKEYTLEEKVQKGIELSVGVTMDKYPNMNLAEFYKEIVDVQKEYGNFFNETKMTELGKVIKENEECIGEIVGYLNGSEKNDEKIGKAIDLLIDLEKKDHPEISETEAEDTVFNLRK